MNVFIENTACTRRKLDVTKLHAYFEVNGYKIAAKPEGADYILVPTCAVKREEEEHSLQLLDSFRNSSGKVIVYGCLPVIARSRYNRNFSYDVLSPAEINDIDRHFQHITHRFSDIADANVIHTAIDESESACSGTTADIDPLQHSVRYVRNKYLGKTPVYYLFTSRGCRGKCSYCAARFAIGPLKSKPLDIVIEEFNRGIESGYRHFILIGDDVGAYGLDSDASFPDLLAALVEESERKRGGAAANAINTIRLHIDEFQPRWLLKYRNDLRDLLTSRRISALVCPLQSGNDRILAMMQRGNDAASIIEQLHDLHGRNPGLALHTKIMAGFPSETEQEFQDTLVQVGGLPLSTVAITSFEEKENTPAGTLEPKVPWRAITERVRTAQNYFRQRGIRTVSNPFEKR